MEANPKNHYEILMDNFIRQKGMTRNQAKLLLDRLPVIETQREISCPICLNEFPAGQGIVLHGCFHSFCRECISKHISTSQNARIQCPFVCDDNTRCQISLRLTEVEAFVSSEDFKKHCEKSIIEETEASIPNSFHCRTPDCKGFCLKEDSTRLHFQCPVCHKNTCMKCETVHSARITCETARFLNMSSEEQRAESERNAKLNEKTIKDNISNGTFQKCPHCSAVIEKNGGCPRMTCWKCKKSFTWGETKAQGGKDDLCVIV